jgi:hypothetical protein
MYKLKSSPRWKSPIPQQIYNQVLNQLLITKVLMFMPRKELPKNLLNQNDSKQARQLPHFDFVFPPMPTPAKKHILIVAPA